MNPKKKFAKDFLALHNEIGEAMLKLLHSAESKDISPGGFTHEVIAVLVLLLRMRAKDSDMGIVRDTLVRATNRALTEVGNIPMPPDVP